MKKRILIVDDEASITRLLKLNLEKTGHYDVREENLGSRAVDAAREFEPDLILLDVMMPDMDGGEVAAGLREDPILRKTPIVFLTAAIKKEELGGDQGKVGGRTYIAKPMNVQGVIGVIERTLAGQSAS
jgi:CheY-like chemotaxis protein